MILQWNDGTVPAGGMGNLVFLHDRVLGLLLPDVLECASVLAGRAVALGEAHAAVARERLAVIEELAAAAEARLALINELTQ